MMAAANDLRVDLKLLGHQFAQTPPMLSVVCPVKPMPGENTQQE